MKLKIYEETQSDEDSEYRKSVELYELKQIRQELDIKISDERFVYKSLEQSRSLYNISVIREIIILLYFCILYALIKGGLLINIKAWGDARNNTVIGKIVDMMISAGGIVDLIFILIILIIFAFMCRKLYLIWLNSDNENAVMFAESRGIETYHIKLEKSNEVIEDCYKRLNEIDKRIDALSKSHKVKS